MSPATTEARSYSKGTRAKFCGGSNFKKVHVILFQQQREERV